MLLTPNKLVTQKDLQKLGREEKSANGGLTNHGRHPRPYAACPLHLGQLQTRPQLKERFSPDHRAQKKAVRFEDTLDLVEDACACRR